ncbi:acyl carrier protein [Actinomyces slackii]|uniref:Acyl carrier protein n=1 Tax=Actinomyces slackii TaxID=52774 RepID=A0A3S4SGZ0_9ACTO|nr:acyl carrier protein [Actinomyces slackii]VEG75780.1 acyl carrier protein [Actinomyces slackii]
MTKLDSSQRAELHDKVCDILEVDPVKVADDTLFEDLGADSMLALEILALLDRDYNLNLDNSLLAEMTCMNSIYAIVDKHG